MSRRTDAFGTALALVVALGPLAAQKRDDRTRPIGVHGRIDQLVLPGGELEAVPAEREAPVMLRILQTWPHGSGFRYDLDWVGFEQGSHDLSAYLRYKPGAAAATLPAIAVEVTAQLPDGAVEPGDLEPLPPPRLGGYQRTLILIGAAWGLGLLAILFVGRRRRRAIAVTAAKPVTLADRLQPLVEAAARGELDSRRQAELERLLLAFWRQRTGLQEVKAGAALARLREHPEAGPLLQQLGRWLHAPPGAGTAIDIAALLAPYRHVAADAADAAEAAS